MRNGLHIYTLSLAVSRHLPCAPVVAADNRKDGRRAFQKRQSDTVELSGKVRDIVVQTGDSLWLGLDDINGFKGGSGSGWRKRRGINKRPGFVTHETAKSLRSCDVAPHAWNRLAQGAHHNGDGITA